jgi:hypothetical protein
MYGIMTPIWVFLVYKNYIGDNEMYYCGPELFGGFMVGLKIMIQFLKAKGS